MEMEQMRTNNLTVECEEVFLALVVHSATDGMARSIRTFGVVLPAPMLFIYHTIVAMIAHRPHFPSAMGI